MSSIAPDSRHQQLNGKTIFRGRESLVDFFGSKTPDPFDDPPLRGGGGHI